MRAERSWAGADMGFYGKRVLPHLIDFAMRNREQARLRKEWVLRARGEVLEVGVGSGLNLAFYSDAVRNVSGVDCSPELLQKVGKRTKNLSFPVDLVRQSVEEEMPFP